MDKKLLKILKVVLILIAIYLVYLIFPGIQKIFNFLLLVILPFLIGFTGAYLLLPIVEWLEKFKIKRNLSVLVVILGFILTLTFMGIFIIPRLINQVDTLIDNLPNYIENVAHLLEKISDKLSFLPDNLKPTPKNVEAFLTSKIANATNALFATIEKSISYFLIIVMSPILMVYFLLDFDNIKKKLKEVLIEKEKTIFYETLIEIDEVMRAYFKGVFLVISVLTILATICFMIIGLDLPLLWGIIIGITDLIPYLGPYIGGAIVVLFALSISFDKAIIVLIAIIVLQLVESNFISPNVHSKTVKTNPILVILSLSFFGKILGIFGMLIAVPFLSIIQIIIKKKIETKKAKKI